MGTGISGGHYETSFYHLCSFVGDLKNGDNGGSTTFTVAGISATESRIEFGGENRGELEPNYIWLIRNGKYYLPLGL